MQDTELIEGILSNQNLSIKTRSFVTELKAKLHKFGSLSEKQKQALCKIYQESGHVLKQDSSTLQIREVKGTCGLCFDGLVSVISQQGLYVFSCSCSLGSQRPEKYPTWLNQIQGNIVTQTQETSKKYNISEAKHLFSQIKTCISEGTQQEKQDNLEKLCRHTGLRLEPI